ncbi:MAG: DNA polymerase domain-containing protein [Candidatus Aenigmarchaeota archaeon]|nr:DNA polymerase domain-containing protein [Candidatus Aenigmarchaeota archaeon]
MKTNLQILDCDYVIVNGKPVVRIFGKTEEGESVCAFYEGFLPYFYLDVDSDHDINDVKFEIEEQGLSAHIVEKFLPLGYSEKPKKIIKIIGRDPSKTPEIREWSKQFGTPYEADILFKYRFMVDFGLRGMGWAEVDGNPARTHTVKCKAIEIKTIKPIDVIKNATLKYLAIDTETVVIQKEGLADFSRDPINMISMVFSHEHKGKKSIVLLTKNTIAKDTIICKDEKEMLTKFKDILIDYDPDILVGYNMENYDMPYILKRMEVLNIPRDIGRSEKQSFTRKYGMTQRTTISGRAIVDPYYIVRYLSVYDQPHKFVRFDLNTVSKTLLGKTKIDVGGWREMAKLWKGSSEDLAKFIEYCKVDSELALELVTSHKLVDMNKFIEMSKLSGLIFEDLMTGQAARHENALLHELKKRNYVMPCKPKRITDASDEIKYKGATVLEPDVGFHADGCVLVLDFKSMYPSMIMHYNICPTTLLKDKEKYKEEQFRLSPINAAFVKKDLKEGIFPYVARYYFDTRFEVKGLMKKERDEEALRILDAKQYALKGMLVSLYGYTGFAAGKFFQPEVAASITSWGRENIAKTKKLVEENFPVKVVYGDTDSVFVKTGINDLDQASQLGEEIAKFVTDRLEGLELQNEKLFKRFLILAKKRYAGWAFEKVDGVWKDKIAMKGIETVRRDWCKLTTKTMRKVLETILKEGDVSKAAKIVRNVAHDISKGTVILDELAIVKGVTKSVDQYDGVVPHVELAKKIMQRDPSRGNMIGERLGYVIIKGNQLVSKRAEDPAYVKEKGLEIDPAYYIQNQVMPPLERIFEVCGISSSELLEGSRQRSFGDIFGKMDPPDKTVLKCFDHVVCKKCHWEFRRPTLNGHCPECGSALYFSGNGSMGKFVEFEN